MYICNALLVCRGFTISCALQCACNLHACVASRKLFRTFKYLSTNYLMIKMSTCTSAPQSTTRCDVTLTAFPAATVESVPHVIVRPSLGHVMQLVFTAARSNRHHHHHQQCKQSYAPHDCVLMLFKMIISPVLLPCCNGMFITNALPMFVARIVILLNEAIYNATAFEINLRKI